MVKVSIILTVYNGEKYINECIDSILSQTLIDFECIIIDDGCVDNTASIIKSYNDKRIQIISRENRGIVASSNEGISKAKGKYIARIDADDIMYPDRLQKQYDYMQNNKECAAVGSHFDIINKNGETLSNRKMPAVNTGKTELGVLIHYITHSGIMIRTSVLRKTSLYRKEFFMAEDKDLLYRLSNYGTIDNIQQTLLKVRIHSDSMTANPLKFFQMAYLHTTSSILHRKNGVNNNQVHFDNWNFIDYTHLYISTALLGLRMIVGFIVKNLFIYR